MPHSAQWEFPPTRWNLIARCHETQDLRGATKALGDLCEDYWQPLYAFARRTGKSPDDAKDCTQGFFCYAIEKELFSRANPELGKLRTFLLTAFKRYMSGEQNRERARKRGGGSAVLPLQGTFGDQELEEVVAADTDTPEQSFEKNWAAAVIRVVQQALMLHEQRAGRGAEFELLKASIADAAGADLSIASLADALGTTEVVVRKKISRLRARFREQLRSEIASTLAVPDPKLVEEELRVLIDALRGR